VSEDERDQGSYEGMDTPWRTDPEVMIEHLGKWVAHTVGDGATVSDVRAPEGNGMSSETLLFTVQPPAGAAAGQELPYVARLAPKADAKYPVFPDYDLALQRDVMQLVADATDVPVPAIAWYEPDASWLGSPFLVMHRVDGVVPSDIPPYPFGGWLGDATTEEQERLERSSLRALAHLHRITPDTHDLGFLARPQHGESWLDQHLNYQRFYYDWGREGQTVPILERTFAALEATRPPEGPGVLNWGDSRIGNMIFADFTPAAVLDWEMAAIGPAEVDVAWMTFMHAFFQEIAERFGMVGMPDFLTRERAMRIYEEEGGLPLEHLDWYEMFAALRFGVVSVRTSLRTIAYGQAEEVSDLDDLIMFKPTLEELLAKAGF
jgi:aminoglycoside phosphotransferase (APT) family kinase protein